MSETIHEGAGSFCQLYSDKIGWRLLSGDIGEYFYRGALLKMSEAAPSILRAGDECSVTLCSTGGPLVSKYTCEVVWCDSEHLGIQFVTSNQ